MPNYRMKAARQRLEIFLYDVIGSDFWGEGVTAKQFALDLKAAGKVDLINVRINSPGGNVFDGLAIYNNLAQHPARVEVDVDGMALSIASIIAMAGDEIRIAANAMMMIHNPHGFAAGDAAELRRQADLMDQVKGNLINTYAARTKRDAGEISGWMDEETWFTAQDAVDHGFADAVTEELAVAASCDATRFRNIPPHLAARLRNERRVPRLDLTNAKYRAQILKVQAKRESLAH